MTSTITFHESRTKKYHPRASVLEEFVRECVGQRVIEIHNNDGKFNVSNLTKNTKVGRNTWTIKSDCDVENKFVMSDSVMESTETDEPDDGGDNIGGGSSVWNRLNALEQEVKILKLEVSGLKTEVIDLQVQVSWLTDETAKPFIHNVASQVLLFLSGDQPLSPSCTGPSRRFSNLRQNDMLMQKIVRITTDDECTIKTKRFLDIGDGIIDRRNSVIHFPGTISLTVQVRKAVEAFCTFPRLYTKCREEYDILSNYDVIKPQF